MRDLCLWPALLAFTLLTACDTRRTDNPAAAIGDTGVKLRVMAFNIEWGGTHVSFDKVVEAIRQADPDIVAVQEAEGNLARLAAEFGWNHDLRNHVISRHRLIDPPGAEGLYVLVEVEPGRIVAVANVHLPSDPYGEYWIADGRSVDAVIAMERLVRMPAIQTFLDVLPPLAENGVPVFLAGDFNSPSHRDWRAEALDRWPYRRFAVDWPVSKAIEASGLRDAWRQHRPDPIEYPGFTWWAERPKIPDYNPGSGDSWQSRIDFIWYAGPAEVERSTLVGERGAADVTIEIDPWPSDHRAVLSDFVVEPKVMPPLVAAGKRLHQDGEPVVIHYSNRTPDGSIVISSESDDGESGTTLRIAAGAVRDTVTLQQPLPASGRYGLSLEDSQRRTVSRNEFRVLPADAVPAIRTGSDSYLQGEALTVSWKNAPGNRWDWVVIYPEGHRDREAYVAWRHTKSRIEGQMALGAEHAATWPLAPGHYVAWLLADDGYEQLARSLPFAIRAADWRDAAPDEVSVMPGRPFQEDGSRSGSAAEHRTSRSHRHLRTAGLSARRAVPASPLRLHSSVAARPETGLWIRGLPQPRRHREQAAGQGIRANAWQ